MEKYEVVHCTTQEEIDFAISKCSSKSSSLYKEGLGLEEGLNSYPEGVAINPDDNAYSGLIWYKDHNAIIHTFQEWCAKFSYNFEDFLLKKAKELYPIGTKFKSPENNQIYTVGNDTKNYYCHTKEILVATDKSDTFNQYLYYQNKWAEIIKEDSINTYGLKIGDKLDCNIITEWAKISNNICHFSDNPIWKQSPVTKFFDNRTIKSFKEINGCLGFEVSDTLLVYLKSEGFKEFMDSYNKSTFILPEKWCINRKNKPEVIEWFNKNSENNNDYNNIMLGDYTHFPAYSNRTYTASIVKEGYKEITFEQFCEHVIKKPLFDERKINIQSKSLHELPLNTDWQACTLTTDTNLIIPKIIKTQNKINYNLDIELPKLNLSLTKNKPKQVKQIILQEFSITI